MDETGQIAPPPDFFAQEKREEKTADGLSVGGGGERRKCHKASLTQILRGFFGWLDLRVSNGGGARCDGFDRRFFPLLYPRAGYGRSGAIVKEEEGLTVTKRQSARQRKRGDGIAGQLLGLFVQRPSSAEELVRGQKNGRASFCRRQIAVGQLAVTILQ